MPPIEAGQGPTFRSANDDLFIYLVEEAAFSLSEAVPPEADMKEVEVKLKHVTALKLGSRGVHPTDVRGDMSLRRKKELEMALGRVQVADKHTWICAELTLVQSKRQQISSPKQSSLSLGVEILVLRDMAVSSMDGLTLNPWTS